MVGLEVYYEVRPYWTTRRLRERIVLGRAVCLCASVYLGVHSTSGQRKSRLCYIVVKAQNILFGGEKKVVTFLFSKLFCSLFIDRAYSNKLREYS